LEGEIQAKNKLTENKKLAPKVRTLKRAPANGVKQKVDTTKCPNEATKPTLSILS
jgi:hypothetical protein